MEEAFRGVPRRRDCKGVPRRRCVSGEGAGWTGVAVIWFPFLETIIHDNCDFRNLIYQNGNIIASPRSPIQYIAAISGDTHLIGRSLFD
jgi:hypothetical protein